MKKIIFAYVPVLHNAYRLFFNEQREAEELYLFDRQFLRQFAELDYIKKDLRALDGALVKATLESWGYQFKIKVVRNERDLPSKKARSEAKVVLANDDIGRFLQEKYLSEQKAEQIELARVFLRWDKNLATKKMALKPKLKISREDFEQETMKLAFKEAEKSADWWRRVGAVIIRDGAVLLAAFNRHLPNNDEAYRSGDPRMLFSSGVAIEMASSIHAEAACIAQAAKNGIKLAGAAIYVTTFPCPICAKQIAYSGIKKLYFAKGYVLLDGLEILKAFDVEVIQVQFDDQDWEAVNKSETKSVGIRECYS